MTGVTRDAARAIGNDDERHTDMRTIIDRYRRPLLAIFGVLLMVIFILPPTFNRYDGSRSNHVVGHIGEDEVRAMEMAMAHQEWETVSRRVVYRARIPSQVPGTPPEMRWVPVANILGVGAQEIAGNPDSYLLLLKEAERMGVTVSPQQIDQILEDIAIPQRDGRIVGFADLENMDEADHIRSAVTRLAMVQSAFMRAADVIKVSQPLRRYVVARQFQQASFSLIEVPASAFAANVPAPTTQQVEEQFRKFADANPDDLDRNPQGFSYRYPDRVKLQVIEVPAAEVRAAAERVRTKDENAQYQWDRDAFKYYSDNAAEFRAQAPATAATSQPTTATTTVAVAPPAAPTTRPFAEVKKEAREAVLKADAAKLARRIQERLVTTMNGDYVAYRNAVNTGGTDAKVPTSSVGVPYNSFEYLQRLAQSIQKDFGVLPAVNAFEKEYLSYRELSTLPGLAQATVEGQPLPAFLMSRAQAFIPPTRRDESAALNLLEPSAVARDLAENMFIVRLTEMQKAHTPANAQEVAADIQRDLHAATAYQQAKAQAEQLLAQAKQAGTLQSVANTTGRKLIDTGLIPFNEFAPIDNVGLNTPAARRAFIRQAFELATSVTPSAPRPLGLIELPRDGRVLVAQVNEVQSSAPDDLLAMFDTQADAAMKQEMAGQLLAEWFDYNSIVARVGYKPAATTPADQTNQPPAGPSPSSPQNRPLI